MCASDFHIQCNLSKVPDLKSEIIFLSRVNFWRVTRKQIVGTFLGGAQASENRGGSSKSDPADAKNRACMYNFSLSIVYAISGVLYRDNQVNHSSLRR